MGDDAKISAIRRFRLESVVVGTPPQTAICLTLVHSTETYEAILSPELAHQIGTALCDAAAEMPRPARH